MIYLMCSRFSEFGKEKLELKKKKSLTALFVKFMVFSPTAVNLYQADENYSAIYEDFAGLPQQIYKKNQAKLFWFIIKDQVHNSIFFYQLTFH